MLLPYAAHDMFDLVERAEHYPQFLPWCTAATIHERSDDWVAARLEFSYLSVRFGFATRNRKARPLSLHVRLVDGPFRHFHGDWLFTPLGTLGCKVSFALSFEVADGYLDALAAPAVQRVARAMLEAFVQRAAATLPACLGAGVPAFVPAQGPGGDDAHTAAVHSPEATVTTADTSLLDAVRASPLARHLTSDEAGVLATVVSRADFPAHAVLAQEGASDHHLYVVVSGALGVVKHHGLADEILLTQLGPGAMAHELGFLDGAERYASLVAQSDTQVLVLTRAALEALIDSHPRVLYGVMRAIVHTVHATQTRLALQASELTNYIVKQHGRY